MGWLCGERDVPLFFVTAVRGYGPLLLAPEDLGVPAIPRPLATKDAEHILGCVHAHPHYGLRFVIFRVQRSNYKGMERWAVSRLKDAIPDGALLPLTYLH